MRVGWLFVSVFAATGCERHGNACEADTDCRNGFACVAADTGGTSACAQSCTTHAECAVGFECDFASGACVESNWCTSDDECVPFACAPREATTTCVSRPCGLDEATGCYTGCLGSSYCAEGYVCSLTFDHLCHEQR